MVTRVRLGDITYCDLRVCMRWVVYVLLSYSESPLLDKVSGWVHRISWRLPLGFYSSSCGMLLTSSRSLLF